MELKKGADRKMVQAVAPKLIWDDKLDFEADMRSHKTLDVYMMQGEVPKTLKSSRTSDINQFYEHGFYDWVILRDDTIHYPEKI